MTHVPRRPRDSKLAPAIAALVLAVCCAGPLVVGVVAASGLGAVLAMLGPLTALSALLVALAVAAWLRRRSTEHVVSETDEA